MYCSDMTRVLRQTSFHAQQAIEYGMRPTHH
jgi:hypothetical protein